MSDASGVFGASAHVLNVLASALAPRPAHDRWGTGVQKREIPLAPRNERAEGEVESAGFLCRLPGRVVMGVFKGDRLLWATRPGSHHGSLKTLASAALPPEGLRRKLEALELL